jgi:hypothetical protein
MTIKDHRLKSGTLTLDALAFASQATNVTLEPDTDTEGEALEVLSGETVEEEEVYTWSLEVEAVQDFDDPAGFIKFCKDNAGEVVPFTWTPTGAAGGVAYSGSVKVRPVRIGGDVNKRLSTPASFPVVGSLVDNYS